MLPPAISVTIDKAKMAAVERAVKDIPNALPKIMCAALKKTSAHARTEIDRQIRAELTVKKRAVMKRIVDEQKPTASNWVWRLGISSRRISVGSFAFRELKSKRRNKTGGRYQGSGGISYSIRKGLRKRIIPAFWRLNPNAREREDAPKVIFRRAGVKGALVPRYPLVFLRGPSLGQVLTDAPGMLAKVAAAGGERLGKEVHSQVDRLLQRRWPK